MLPQVNSGQQNLVKTVYFYNDTGASVTIREGYAFCYDLDDTNAPAVPGATVDRRNTRGNRVLRPATATLAAFAGVATQSQAGLVVPASTGAFVEINVPVPGGVAIGWTKVSMTKGTTTLNVTNGTFELSNVADSTFNLAWVGTALETFDSSTTAAGKLIRFK
jgi:hypothetical protein